MPSEEAEMVFGVVLTDLTEQEHHEQIVADETLARLILEQAVPHRLPVQHGWRE